MKNKNGLSYLQLVLFAVLTEFALIAMQFVYLNVYATNANSEFAFTTDYMKTKGFYIFQVIGFFLYTTLVYLVAGRINNKIFNKLAALVVAGGIVELTFYMTMTANYEGAFLYSTLDKIIAAAFGLILFNYTTDKRKGPESYV